MLFATGYLRLAKAQAAIRSCKVYICMINKKKYILLTLAILIIAVTALPYLWLSCYSVPMSDDFLYAAESRDLGIFGAVKMWYFEFTGRYISSMVMSLLPIRELNFTIAQIFPIMLIVGLIGGLYYCVHAFKFFSRLQAALLSAVIFSVYLSTLVSPGEVIYWLSGGVTYMLPIVIMLFLWGYIVRVYSSGQLANAVNIILASLGCILLSGSNEIIIFYHGFLSLLFFVFTLRIASPYRKLATVIFILTTVCSLISLLAPGNSERHNFMTVAKHASPTMMHSIEFTINVIITWLYLRAKRFAFIFLLVAVPAILLISKQPFDKRPRLKLHPVWPALIFFAGYLFAYLPVTISLTEYYPDRTLDCIYFTFLIFATVTLAYAGVYYGLDNLGSKGFRRLSYVLLFVGLFALVADRKTNTAKAYTTIITKAHVQYKAQLNARLKKLYQNRGQNLVKVEPVAVNPKPMIFADVDTIVHSTNNFGYEVYFKIDTVLATKAIDECMNCD